MGYIYPTSVLKKISLEPEAEAEVSVAVAWRIVVAISRTAVGRVVVVAAAAIHAIRAGGYNTSPILSQTIFSKFIRLNMTSKSYQSPRPFCQLMFSYLIIFI